MTKIKRGNFTVSKEEQLEELQKRIPPILNVNIAIFKKDLTDKKNIYKFLIGRRNPLKDKNKNLEELWLFPGGRMKYTESPQETANRILKKELPGVNAKLKKLAGVLADKGYDYKCYGVTIYYLYEYESGKPQANIDLDDFIWVNANDMRNKKYSYPIDIKILDEMEAAVRSMNTSQDEIIVEVNKNNKEIGYAIKRELHSDNKRFHRAAHMMVFTSKGDVILHQRSFTKTSGAGLWDMFGGHQVYGHTIEQTAKQELIEELGIETNLTFVRTGLFQNEKQSEFYYLYYGIHDGPYGYDRNEVEQIKVFDSDKLLNGDYDDEYEFVEPFTKMYIKELKPIWEKLKQNKK